MTIPIRLYRIRLIALLLMMSVTVGCAAGTLRDAQDHFNKGAEVELRAIDHSLLSDNPVANPGDAFAALNEYRLANSEVDALIKKDSKALIEAKLLGAAYMLKAMSLWRISDLEGDILKPDESSGAATPVDGVTNSRQELLNTLNKIEGLQSNREIVLGTRDKVLYKALYGFYDHDGGRSENDYSKARDWFKSAYERLEEALSDNVVPVRHPVRVYVGSAQLRTLAAWNLALYELRKDCSSNPALPSCDLLNNDQTFINDETKEVICKLRPFYRNNNEVRNQLIQLLSPIGLPSAINNPCP
jgi:hypothetical protein